MERGVVAQPAVIAKRHDIGMTADVLTGLTTKSRGLGPKVEGLGEKN